MVLKMNASQVLEHIQLNNIILAAAGDGVRNGLTVSEKGTPDMSVDIAAGTAMVGGTAYTEGSTVNLAIEAAHATLHRKDLITYDPTTSNPVVTKGADHAGGTADPIYPPDIPAGDILLAIITVGANETEITNSEVMGCIVEITKLDELGTPSDSTALDASTAVHGLLKKLPNNAAQYMNGVGGWTVPAGAGDMSKSVYDTNDNGVVDNAETASAVTWNNVSGKPSTFPPSAHSATLITSDLLPVTRGGTGVSSIGTVALVNATQVDGCSAGILKGDVYKVASYAIGSVLTFGTADLQGLLPSTSGYQLTTQGTGSFPIWAAASDLIFTDTHCPKCGKEFQDGDDLILHVIGHNEVGDILTIPMHLSCANEPKKTVMVQRKVMEDHFSLDEETGELVVQRVQKTQKKTVTRHKLKEGYSIDDRTGTACKVKYRAAVHDLKEAIEETEETIEEPVYEDVEYRL